MPHQRVSAAVSDCMVGDGDATLCLTVPHCARVTGKHNLQINETVNLNASFSDIIAYTCICYINANNL